MNADLVSQLHPPRLPVAFTQLGWPDLLAGFGVGLVLAALVILLATPFLNSRPRPKSLARRLEDIRALPPPQRLQELARLHADQGRTLPDDLRHALYAASPDRPDQIADQIEALILASRPRSRFDASQTGDAL